MMAQLGALPAHGEGEWAAEMKWDGIRCLTYVEDQGLRLLSRNGRDITLAYPELYPLAGAVAGHDLVLDGELVAFDETGRPSFGALVPRMHQRRPSRVAELAASVPVTYMIFDVLYVNSAPAIGLPYEERRVLLERMVTVAGADVFPRGRCRGCVGPQQATRAGGCGGQAGGLAVPAGQAHSGVDEGQELAGCSAAGGRVVDAVRG